MNIPKDALLRGRHGIEPRTLPELGSPPSSAGPSTSAPAGAPEPGDQGALIQGPSQKGPATLQLELKAAVQSATTSLARVRRQLAGGQGANKAQHAALGASLEQASKHFEAAINHPELGEEGRRQLALELGELLTPLGAVMQALADAQPPIARSVRRQITAAMDRLLAPTALLWGSAAAEARVTAGQFVSIPRAKEAVGLAYQQLQTVLEQLEASGHPLDPAGQVALFKAILASEFSGLFMSIDAGVFDFLPTHLAKAITRDHHGIHADPQNPQINSTMHFLNDVEAVRKLDLPLGEKIARLQHQYAYCVTDNLGDAVFPLVLIRHLPELVEKGGIAVAMKEGHQVLMGMDQIRRLAHFEDFGFFGSANLEEGKIESGPGEIVFRDLAHVVLGNFQGFDESLNKFGVYGADRFEQLAPEQQQKLIEECAQKVEQNLSNYDLRMVRVNTFKANINRAKSAVEQGHRKLDDLLRPHLPKKDLELLHEHVFFFEAPQGGGRFATWDAPSLVHQKKIQWQCIRFPDDQWGMVLAVPHGRTPDNLKNRNLVATFKEAFPNAVDRGDSLLFVFDPKAGLGPPENVAKRLVASLKEGAVPVAPAPAGSANRTSIRLVEADGVFGHDPYLYQDGKYVWTEERLIEAKRRCLASFARAVALPTCAKVVMVAGPAAAGKSTFIGQNYEAGVAYYDSTLSTPEDRKTVIDVARMYGKPVELVVIRADEVNCLERNQRRDPDRQVPAEMIRRVIDNLQSNPPTKAEGIDEIRFVQS